MNFKIVNRFLVFALSLCTVLLLYGTDGPISERNHLDKFNKILRGEIGHQSLQSTESNNLPFKIEDRVEPSTEDDENLDSDVDLEKKLRGGSALRNLFFYRKISNRELNRWVHSSCPIYIRTHSLLI